MENIGFSTLFRQTGSTQIVRITTRLPESDVIAANPNPDGLLLAGDDHQDINNDMEELEWLMAQLHELKYLIAEKKYAIAQHAFIHHSQDIKDCDSLKCVFKTVTRKAKHMAHEVYGTLAGGGKGHDRHPLWPKQPPFKHGKDREGNHTFPGKGNHTHGHNPHKFLPICRLPPNHGFPHGRPPHPPHRGDFPHGFPHGRPPHPPHGDDYPHDFPHGRPHHPPHRDDFPKFHHHGPPGEKLPPHPPPHDRPGRLHDGPGDQRPPFREPVDDEFHPHMDGEEFPQEEDRPLKAHLIPFLENEDEDEEDNVPPPPNAFPGPEPHGPHGGDRGPGPHGPHGPNHGPPRIVRVFFILKFILISTLASLFLFALYRRFRHSGSFKADRRSRRERRRAYRRSIHKHRIMRLLARMSGENFSDNSSCDDYEEKRAELLEEGRIEGTITRHINAAELVDDVVHADDIPAAQPASISAVPLVVMPPIPEAQEGTAMLKDFDEELPAYEASEDADSDSIISDGFRYTPGSSDYIPSHSVSGSVSSILGLDTKS
jgi:hypothetical protein